MLHDLRNQGEQSVCGPAAVAELEKHRQFDEAHPKRSPTMKGGISEAQWTGLSEENHSRKGKAAMTELPKSMWENGMISGG